MTPDVKKVVDILSADPLIGRYVGSVYPNQSTVLFFFEHRTFNIETLGEAYKAKLQAS